MLKTVLPATLGRFVGTPNRIQGASDGPESRIQTGLQANHGANPGPCARRIADFTQFLVKVALFVDMPHQGQHQRSAVSEMKIHRLPGNSSGCGDLAHADAGLAAFGDQRQSRL
jgi:hypothetical protein